MKDNKLQTNLEKNEDNNKFKNIFYPKEEGNKSYNNLRKVLCVLSILFIILLLITLEIQCLYFNNCYGENYEMEYWISQSIVPISIILLVINILLYISLEYIIRSFIYLMVYIYIIMTLTLLGFGLYSIFIFTSKNINDMQSKWIKISNQSKIYYYNNSLQVLFDIYKYKMITTGIFFIIFSIISLIISFLSYKLSDDKQLNNWRPKLKSKISESRSQRLTDYYDKYGKRIEELRKERKEEIKETPIIKEKDNTSRLEIINENNRNDNNYGSNVNMINVDDKNDKVNISSNEINNEIEKLKSKGIPEERNKKQFFRKLKE